MKTLASFLPEKIKVLDQAETNHRIRKAILNTGVQKKLVAKRMKITAAYLSDLTLGRRPWSEKLVERAEKAIEALKPAK